MTCFSDAWSVHAFDMSGLQSERDVDFMCTGDCFLWDQDETHMGSTRISYGNAVLMLCDVAYEKGPQCGIYLLKYTGL